MVAFDAFDIIAFLVFAMLIAVAVILVVTLGQLPGRIALKRGHPQAAAINVTSWLGVATLGFLWPVALIWAFLIPIAPVSPGLKEKEEVHP
jgi:Protein of unknown function (DUF3302)